MHPELSGLVKTLEHAQRACEANAAQMAEIFGVDHPYNICYTRLSNKVRYAREVIEFYARCFGFNKKLDETELERIIETQKWYFIGTLSVIEYSIPSFLGERGSSKLRELACDGPFSPFLKEALSENIIGEDEKKLFDFLHRARNDIIHRNAVSRDSTEISYKGRTYTLCAGEMIEGPLCMLADLGALAACLVEVLIKNIEDNLN